MATHRVSILNSSLALDSGVFQDLVANQITEAVAPSVGGILAIVVADGGSDIGVQGRFAIPKNYVGTPKIVVKGILDGAPGAADVLGWGFRKRAVANNEAADATYDAEQIVSATIGSGGTAHSDEDLIEQSITLTAGDYAVDDEVLFWFYIDASVNDYAGNVLITDVQFEYTDT